MSLNMNNISAKLNSLLPEIDSLLCNTECQRNKTLDELKEKVQNAQASLDLAPDNLKAAQQKYLLELKGSTEYIETRKKELSSEVDKVISTYLQNFKSNLEKLNELKNIQDVLTASVETSAELGEQYGEKNRSFLSHMDEYKTNVITNDRRSFYENQNYESLIYWYWIILILYCIFSLFYIRRIYFSTSNNIKKGAITFCIILYPILVSFYITYFLKFIYSIYDFFPKNIYLDNSTRP
jgi:hypothetical protein